MMAAKGGAADDVGRLRSGEFYFATRGVCAPDKNPRAALSLPPHTKPADDGGGHGDRAAGVSMARHS